MSMRKIVKKAYIFSDSELRRKVLNGNITLVIDVEKFLKVIIGIVIIMVCDLD